MLVLLHADDDLVAVDKPSGLVVHRSEQAGDAVNCMRLLRGQLGRWVWPVHRLDRGTSGVLLFGLDAAGARALHEAFARREVEKEYLAVVRGLAPERATVEGALDGGGAAVTAVERLAEVELPHAVGRYATARYSLVRARPLSGRRHQVRRHLARLSHPIVGDVNHGDGKHNRFFRERFGVRRLLLHASRVALPHPRTGEPLALAAPLPGELRTLWAALGWEHLLH